MEFLVTFEVEIPNGTTEVEVEQRTGAEATAAAQLAEGHLLHLWKRSAAGDDNTAIGLYTATSDSELERLLRDLPLADWMQITITLLAPHPNDPAAVVR
jgi:muconolactone delta-isomerase